jgi:5-methylcytosine-specific restriction endonuclease McrA
VEGILAEYQTFPMPRDRVRTVVVRVPMPRSEIQMTHAVGGAAAGGERSADAAMPTATNCVGGVAPSDSTSAHPDACIDACENSAYHRNGCEDAGSTSRAPAQLEKRILLEFSVHSQFLTKLNRIRSLAGHRLPSNASLEQLFDFVMDLVIDREDPAKRIERRERRVTGTHRPVSSKLKNSARHIPASTRDKIFQRDKGRCTFVGPDGHHCGANVTLQVDHIRPVALGGTSSLDNLRLLCALHNRLEAERLLGPAAQFRRAEA